MTRRLVLALAPLLLLAACGDKQTATVNETISDSGLEQENVIAGDVTAIDAATADDARMANDVAPPAFDDEGGNSTNGSGASNAGDNQA